MTIEDSAVKLLLAAATEFWAHWRARNYRDPGYIRVAGALALENLEGVRSCEEKAAAAYRAMVLA